MFFKNVKIHEKHAKFDYSFRRTYAIGGNPFNNLSIRILIFLITHLNWKVNGK